MKNKFLEKYCYIMYPVITICLICIIYVVLQKLNINIILAKDFSNTIIQISGTLIGFLLTAITIFLSLPKDTEVMKRVKKYKHHIIFSRCIFFGLFFSILSIFLWTFNISEMLVLISFGLALEETIMAVKYIYKLCIYNFE